MMRKAPPIRTAMMVAAAVAALTLTARAADTSPTKAQARTASQMDTDESETQTTAPLDVEWMPFPDKVRFKVLGLPWFDENSPDFWRMPKAQFASLPRGVQRRAKMPSGARILVKCNTTKMGMRVTPAAKGSLKGFDVYINGKYLRSAVAEEAGVKTDLVLFKDLDAKQKEILVYLPYHQEVTVESVGVDKGTVFSAPEHEFAGPLPLMFYGSSVCQGNGALKPGMTYPAIVARRLNLDFVNLGFGGAGKAEKNVVDLVNSVSACCYVLDLGKSYGMQDKTAFVEMLKSIRKAHPQAPIICITPITSSLEVHSESYSKRSIHTRAVMRDAVKEVMQAGEKKVQLIEGTELLGFSEHDGLSKDGVHPTDYGYGVIAGKLLPIIRKVIGTQGAKGITG